MRSATPSVPAYLESLRVLIVDDDENYQQVAKRVIEGTGVPSQITLATDYASALYLAVSEYHDLIILDLVLHPGTPGPQETWEGMWLLQELLERGLQGHIGVIILTQFGDVQTATHIWNNFNIIDFWEKKEEEENLAAKLRLALDRIQHFGLHSEVNFTGNLSWQILATDMGYQFRRLSSPIAAIDAELELRHLLRKVLRDSTSINIMPLAPGHSGAAVVRASPVFSDNSQGAEDVVKYGSAQQISEEISRWKAISQYINGPKITYLKDAAIGTHLGAIRYSFVGGTQGQIHPFSEIYARKSVSEIAEVIDRLFMETCGLWYQERNRVPAKGTQRYQMERMYSEYLGFSRDKIKQAFVFKYPEQPLKLTQISFGSIPRKFTHPIAAICDGKADFSTETWLCRTHGDLHPGNIFVDERTHDCWLIDFYRTGLGHWLRDFAALEAAVKFQLIPASDLEALFEMEDALAHPESLVERPDYSRADQPEISKGTSVIAHLRSVAAKISSTYNPQSGMLDYYIALFYETVNYVRFHQLIRNRNRKNQVLLSAAILYEKIQTFGKSVNP